MDKQIGTGIDYSVGYNIPTYDHWNKQWTYTTFYSHQDFKNFVESCFKEPGEYGFDQDYLIVNEEARKFKAQEFYCPHPTNTKDYKEYWDKEKEKCRKGLIIKAVSGKVWYVTRDYYMWLNFLPIFHKEKRKNLFPDLYDGQYHTALYEFIGELRGEHAVILKKRQYAMSYYHMAKLINQIWFEENITLKLIAYLDAYIGQEGSWAFLNEYRDFLNDHTAWYRPFEPDKIGNWQQRIKVTINGRDKYRGRKGRLMSISTQQSPTKGVGGASRYIIAEESGINPTLDKTYGYAKSALEAGPMITVGQFIAYGSVGDLKQCEPLRDFMLKPKENGFFGVPTKFFNENTQERICGLFIPEVWNMLPFSDEFGNSDVQGAIDALLAKRVQQKKDLTPEAYQLEVSQHPIYIEEAFAVRGEPVFPAHIVGYQLNRIRDGLVPVEYVDFKRNISGVLEIVPSKKLPISDFPVDKKMEDKSSVICMYEKPIGKPAWGTYYASIDPVSEGKTTTSDSLCSIIVYKTDEEVTKDNGNGDIKTNFEGGRIVCTWCGRFDDINKTHERLENIIEIYNAWTLVEANISLFIQYMISKRKQRYLALKSDIPFLKEYGSNNTAYQDYGWKNTGNIFKLHLLSYGIEFIKTIMDFEPDEYGEPKPGTIKYGVERIPDPMILKEMQEYFHGLNVDRLVSYCALVAFVQIQSNNRGIRRRVEVVDKLENTEKFSKLNMSPFRHIGQSNSTKQTGMQPKRNPFKNLR